jgi:hypothetical protein
MARAFGVKTFVDGDAATLEDRPENLLCIASSACIFFVFFSSSVISNFRACVKNSRASRLQMFSIKYVLP